MQGSTLLCSGQDSPGLHDGFYAGHPRDHPHVACLTGWSDLVFLSGLS